MAPIIASAGQTRSRLPPKWMQNASVKAPAATMVENADLDVLLKENSARWSTHTLAADLNGTICSRADSTTSTYVDTFAHRRKARISDMTFADSLDNSESANLTRTDSLASSLNDLSLTLNDDDDTSRLSDLTKHKVAVIDNARISTHSIHDNLDDRQNSDEDEERDDDMPQRIDRLMAATMEALEASNRLVLDTLSSRAKLAKLNAMEAALDSHLDAREAHLLRQIQAVKDMTDFVSRTSAELQKLTSPSADLRVSSRATSAGQITTLTETAGLQVRDAAATGIVQALDRDATIGKTAAKRLERMLQSPSPNSSPSSAASPQRRNTHANRRAFSISDFANKQSSIAEERQHEVDASLKTHARGNGEQHTSGAPPSTGNRSDSRTSTPQKKLRAVSYDSRSPGAMSLMSKLAGPSKAPASSAQPVPPTLAGTTVRAAASPVPIAASMADPPSLKQRAARPALLSALCQDSSLASSRASLASSTYGVGALEALPQTQGVSELPRRGTGASSEAFADATALATGAVTTDAESTLAARIAMPSVSKSALTPTRTETPSDSSYFDSAVGDSISSASPPTPGSMHAIQGVLATPWECAASDVEGGSIDVASPLERSTRRTSVYSSALSPRPSLSLSDRDRAQQLSSQLAELRAERVMWNSQFTNAAELSQSGASTSAADARGGGALRALQRLNQMSATKIAGQKGAHVEDDGANRNSNSKRVSLGLGLPSFSGMRPSASRSTSADTSAATSRSSAPLKPAEDMSSKSGHPRISHEDAAGDTGTGIADLRSANSLLGAGWRSWTSWNTSPAAAADETVTTQK